MLFIRRDDPDVFSLPESIGGKMIRSILLFTVSAALLLLLAAVLLWISLDLGMEGIAKHRHGGYIVAA